MLNTQNTTNRNRNTNRNNSTRSNGKGTKRGNTRRATQYFVIQAKSNNKVNINDKEHEILQSWLELKAQESAVDEQLDAMKNVVVAIVGDLGGAVKFRGFEFTDKVRTTYEFSAEVADLEKRLKALKAKEIENGSAHPVRETEYVEVRAIEK